MYRLWCFRDFPACRRPYEQLDCGTNRRKLENQCRAFFREKENTNGNIMLCIVKVETGEVVYPVISSKDGTQEHPRDDRGAGEGQGWSWYSEANQIQNHKSFTAQLKKRQAEGER